MVTAMARSTSTAAGNDPWRCPAGTTRRGNCDNETAAVKRRGATCDARCPGGAQRNGRNGNALRRNVTRRNRPPRVAASVIRASQVAPLRRRCPAGTTRRGNCGDETQRNTAAVPGGAQRNGRNRHGTPPQSLIKQTEPNIITHQSITQTQKRNRKDRLPRRPAPMRSRPHQPERKRKQLTS